MEICRKIYDTLQFCHVSQNLHDQDHRDDKQDMCPFGVPNKECSTICYFVCYNQSWPPWILRGISHLSLTTFCRHSTGLILFLYISKKVLSTILLLLICCLYPVCDMPSQYWTVTSSRVANDSFFNSPNCIADAGIYIMAKRSRL